MGFAYCSPPYQVLIHPPWGHITPYYLIVGQHDSSLQFKTNTQPHDEGRPFLNSEGEKLGASLVDGKECQNT